MSRIKLLAKSGLMIVEVMAICIMWGVQSFEYRGKPMWHFNGEDDVTRCGRKGPDSASALARTLSDLYKGDEEEFHHIKPRDGFSMYNPPNWVSCYSFPRVTYAVFFAKIVCFDIYEQELGRAIEGISSPSP